MDTVATRLEHYKHVARVSVALSIATFKTTYARSWLGYVWYVLNPLILFGVLLLLKHTGDVFTTNTPNYPLYLLIGIVFFQYFIKTTTAGLTAFRRNRNLIKHMQLPLEVFVLSHCLTFAYAHAFDFFLVCIVALLLGGSSIGLIAYPFVFILLALTTFGITILLAPIATAIADMTSIWSFVGTFLLLVTPIFYVVDDTSIVWSLNMANPLFVYIQLARELLLYGAVHTNALLISALLFSILTPVCGMLIFNARKQRIPELL